MFLVKVKNYSLVTKHACLEYMKKFVYTCIHVYTYTQDMLTDYKKQMTSQEFAHEHVFKGLNDR